MTRLESHRDPVGFTNNPLRISFSFVEISTNDFTENRKIKPLFKIRCYWFSTDCDFSKKISKSPLNFALRFKFLSGLKSLKNHWYHLGITIRVMALSNPTTFWPESILNAFFLCQWFLTQTPHFWKCCEMLMNKYIHKISSILSRLVLLRLTTFAAVIRNAMYAQTYESRTMCFCLFS